MEPRKLEMHVPPLCCGINEVEICYEWWCPKCDALWEMGLKLNRRERREKKGFYKAEIPKRNKRFYE